MLLRPLVFLAALIPLCFSFFPFRLPYFLLLFELGVMEFARDFLNVNRWLRELHAERLESLRDDPRNSEITKPFVIRWDDEPERVLRAGLANGFFVGGDVIVP